MNKNVLTTLLTCILLFGGGYLLALYVTPDKLLMRNKSYQGLVKEIALAEARTDSLIAVADRMKAEHDSLEAHQEKQLLKARAEYEGMSYEELIRKVKERLNYE